MQKKLFTLSAAVLLLAACDTSEPAEQQAVVSTASHAAAAQSVAKTDYDWAADIAALCERRNGVWAALHQAVPDPEICFSEADAAETDAARTEQLTACFKQQAQQLQTALPQQWQGQTGTVYADFQISQYGHYTLRYLLPVNNGKLYGVPLRNVMIDVNLEESEAFGSVEPVLQLSGSLKEAQAALQGKFAATEKFYLDDEVAESGEQEFDSMDAALQSRANLTASDVYSKTWQPQLMQNNTDHSFELLCMPLVQE